MKKLLVIFISITSIVQGQTTGDVDTTKFDFNLDSKPFNKKKWFFQSKHYLPENDKEDGIEYFNNTFY